MKIEIVIIISTTVLYFFLQQEKVQLHYYTCPMSSEFSSSISSPFLLFQQLSKEDCLCFNSKYIAQNLQKKTNMASELETFGLVIEVKSLSLCVSFFKYKNGAIKTQKEYISKCGGIYANQLCYHSVYYVFQLFDLAGVLPLNFARWASQTVLFESIQEQTRWIG